MKTSQSGFVKTVLIVLAALGIIVFLGLYFLSARYANNPFAVLQDSYTLSSDKTKADILDNASKTNITSLAFQAKKLKQENGSYIGFCNIQFIVGDEYTSGIKGSICNESQNSYAISIPITSGKYLCVDDSDIIRKLDVNLSVGEVKCPTTAPVML